MNVFNGKCHFSGSCSSETHRPIYKKLHCSLCRWLGLACKFWGVHAWSCRRRASVLLLFLCSMRIASYRSAHWIDQCHHWLTWCILVAFNCFVIWKIKIYIYPFYPKIRKFALRPLKTLKLCNLGTAKGTCKMLAPNMGFWGRQFNDLIQICSRMTITANRVYLNTKLAVTRLV